MILKSQQNRIESVARLFFPQELIENFAINLHRIDKDVQRCDRNLAFFSQPSNLEKLRNVITTYVWDNLDVGYMQVIHKLEFF